MKGLARKIRTYWDLLHKDIYMVDKDLHDSNIKACLFVGIAVALAASATTTLNLIMNRDIITILTTISQVIGGILIVFFTLRGNKEIPTLIMLLICVVTFTYYTFSGATGGTTIIWTILAPLGIGFFGNALYGIYCGAYFELLFIILFYTPLRHLVQDKYSRFFMDRYPVLYFLNLALVSICLFTYHMSVLKLMDAAEELTYGM